MKTGQSNGNASYVCRRGATVEIKGHVGVLVGLSGDFVRVGLSGMGVVLGLHPYEIVNW